MGLFKKKKKDLNQLELTKITNGSSDARIINKENKKLWYTIGVAASCLLIIFLVSCILSIYNSASKINLYFGIAMTVISVLLILIFIVRPIVKVLTAPSFSLDATKPIIKLSNKNYRTLKSVAKNIMDGENSVPFEQKEKIKNALKDRYLLRKELNVTYDKYIRKDITKIIWATSSRVACTTGISKNNTFDALTTIFGNIRMVMQIVVKCGYRPSYPKLAKLIFKVFRNALIAYSIESMNIGEVITNCCSKFFKDIPALGKPIAAIMEGAANGFLTARIGVITRKYLYSEFSTQNVNMSIDEMEQTIAKEASKEAKWIIDDNGALANA